MTRMVESSDRLVDGFLKQRGHVIGVAESMLAGPLPSWLEKRARDPDTAAIAKAW
jgi:hypothetical protein